MAAAHSRLTPAKSYSPPPDRLYCQALAGGEPRAITPAFGSFASPAVSPDGRWVVFVHSYESIDGLALVDIEGELFPRKLAYGTDFVMQPAWHPSADFIAYIAWNHPQMPWTGSELRLLKLSLDGAGIPAADDIVTVCGDQDTAVFQPEFSPDGGYLSYISDASGWGQLYLYDLQSQEHRQLTTSQAEHGAPAWIQGLRVHGWSSDSRSIYYLENKRGFVSLMRYDVANEQSEPIPGFDDYTHIEQIAVSSQESIAAIASSSLIPPRVVSLNDGGQVNIHRRRGAENLQADQLSAAQALSWTCDDGGVAHGLFYPPVLKDEMPPGKPPLIVDIHGGPTSQRYAAYASEVQFFATRGYAVLQVNHRGSTGYGKAYMDMHRGNWGVYDVTDAIAGVKHLADEGCGRRRQSRHHGRQRRRLHCAAIAR